VTLEAANVDHKVFLKVNGKRVVGQDVADLKGDHAFGEQDDYTYEPSVPRSQWQGDPKDWAGIKIGFQGTPLVVNRLRINRDVYYTNDILGGPTGGVATEGHPKTLGADEFFAMGDNSPRSQDGRWWSKDPKLASVPRANLVGKAFFVYWPAAGKRIIPLPVVPDVKDFRLIH
jgi:signal peptidase I